MRNILIRSWLECHAFMRVSWASDFVLSVWRSVSIVSSSVRYLETQSLEALKLLISETMFSYVELNASFDDGRSHRTVVPPYYRHRFCRFSTVSSSELLIKISPSSLAHFLASLTDLIFSSSHSLISDLRFAYAVI
jgi:hypothetical protein